jgi:hypothetical protein
MIATADRDSAHVQRELADARRAAAELGAVLADAATVSSVGDQVSADGLIERRREDIDDGIARVRKELQAWRCGEPLGVQCEQLVTALTAQPQLDDICVLAVCRSG